MIIKKLLMLTACIVWILTADAQKRQLDELAYSKWKYISKSQMSDDGRWVSYEHRDKDSLRVMYLWNKEKTDTLKDCSGANFSGSSRYVIYYRKQKQTGKEKKQERVYALRDLDTGETEEFTGITSLTFLNEQSEWVKMIRPNILPDSLKKITGKESYDVVLYNPQNKDSVCFRQQTMNRECMDGKGLLLRSAEGWKLYNSVTRVELPLPLDYETEISMVNFSNKEDNMACIYKEKGKQEQYLLLYDIRKRSLLDTISSASDLLPEGFEVTSGRLSFSKDGRSLFFRIGRKVEEVKEEEKISTVTPQIWVWNETSNFLAMAPVREQEFYFCALNLGKKKLTLLNSAEVPYLQFPDGENEELTISFSDKNYRHLTGIEAGPLFDSYLIDMKTGKQTKILERKYYNPSISTDKQYIVWFEPDVKAWYSMNTYTLEKRNLTASISDKFYNDKLDRPMHNVHFGSLGWTEKGHSVFVNSEYDFWLIDASGEKDPVCLTKGMGRKKEIVFRPIKTSESQRYYSSDSTFYFTAFQPLTKKAGYYRLKQGDFRELVFTAHRYSQLTFSKDGNTCLWKRESFAEYPELYISDSDFRNVHRISVSDEIQEEYLWGTSELVEWRTFQGDTIQGLLCKPEDFDPNKKYPMIVYFYEKKSDNLNKYNIPSPIGTVINWTYCVSNGYLVFVPDVTFRCGDPGRSSYDAVVSGVKALTDRYNFVDENRIGLNGHSWGGYQSAYLITQTDMFKVAVTGAPVVNMTSAYGAVRWSTGKSRMFQYEYGQSRIGGSLWEKPIEYIKNSPLFFVPQVHTPVLIMHNDQDGSVTWEQGIEFFMALRRLGKPVWMFNYKGQGHKLLKWEHRLDYSRRVMEFYDYYLKDGNKPEWM